MSFNGLLPQTPSATNRSKDTAIQIRKVSMGCDLKRPQLQETAASLMAHLVKFQWAATSNALSYNNRRGHSGKNQQSDVSMGCDLKRPQLPVEGIEDEIIEFELFQWAATSNALSY